MADSILAEKGEVTASPFVPGRFFVWADKPTTAKEKIEAHLRNIGVAVIPDMYVTWSGLTRPGSYDYDFDGAGKYTENVGKTLRRYTVNVSV